MDGSTKNDDAEAMRLGWEAGKIEKSSACDCPYEPSVFGLRFAWLDGFSKGRVELQKATGTEPAI
ncbi:hypothetical protein FV232_05145 [Methylobacterium sp. WL30]|uniref:hypothetical protein n=1 Tax=unclassified Methylobacterium TaxID=2615210 RepID=UPI0011CC20AC|nr:MULTISPECIES: hypothetical protein [unclassified Methylobacterium]TXN40494.1 hypothetical protein FV225_05975 [Methylobacterium sp. WL93]TXN52297.1 hypothetical protein FV227_04400 [Methylobacterium sp. WL119]TXN69670.1 hypothetical protein FV232_05145 [Methylobacterium sp. WL30]